MRYTPNKLSCSHLEALFPLELDSTSHQLTSSTREHTEKKINLSLRCCWVGRSTALVVQSTAWASAVSSQGNRYWSQWICFSNPLASVVCVCVCGWVDACSWQLWMDMPEIAHCRILFFLSLLRLKNNNSEHHPSIQQIWTSVYGHGGLLILHLNTEITPNHRHWQLNNHLFSVCFFFFFTR